MAGEATHYFERSGTHYVHLVRSCASGPLFVGGKVDGPLYLVQSLYMVSVGLLLGELHRVTELRVIFWVGHVVCNVTVLLLFTER